MRGLDLLGHGEGLVHGNGEAGVVQAAARPGHIDPDHLAGQVQRSREFPTAIGLKAGPPTICSNARS